ncbi:OmpA family protein [Phenylobacterium deserti]|uniref:OmpA-like domain-containing protein n=1 Tax=Phenylobacterium deserti TaxID=1914756 RepID=A0A328AR92_9CAUL|nr:OmpA family protein [Phenylobacterium deserti]RAK57553.1 hypothetical protein DJ018_06370 [Phenylobacterium deserti]
MLRQSALLVLAVLSSSLSACAHRVEPQISQAVLDARAGRDVAGDACGSQPAKPAPISVQFPFGETELSPAGQRAADGALAWLICHPNGRAVIRGAADGHGSAAAQTALANSRAQAVQTYLIGKGVEARLTLAAPDAPDPQREVLLIAAEGRRW